MVLPPNSMVTLNEGMYLFHHVFLPQKLPQESDYNAHYENVLLDKVILALRDLSNLIPDQDTSIFAAATTTMSRLRSIIGSHGDLDEARLRNALEQLHSEGGVLPIYVHKQNAAVLLSRNDNGIHVESFELSPRNESVYATIGRLQRQFPGPTLALNLNTFKDPDLQNVIAQTLARMSHQPVAGTKPKVKKADQQHDEDRDTIHPKMVTEFFMAFLRLHCIDVDGTQIQKNTREEVLWHDCLSPWRRSALWLLVRVSLQLVFCRLSEEERADDLYKTFMVYFMSSIISMVPKTIPSENLYAMNAKVARRLLKLGLPDKPAWLSSVQDELKQSNHVIQKRWGQIIRQQNSLQAEMSFLASLNFSQDVFYTLPSLDGYLEGIEQRGLRRSPAATYYQPESSFRKHLANELPVYLDFADTDYGIYNLAAFEEWIELNLDAWLDENETADTCTRLRTLMLRYHQAALSSYWWNPEAISVMLLTLLELWIACDKSANSNIGILHMYDPGIPVDVFQSLLLPFKSQMVRLARAEQYLYLRQQNRRFSSADVFINIGTEYCFSVRYFDQSRVHKHLYEEIEAWADQERAKKKLEFQEKKQQYERLQQRIRETGCEYEEVVIDWQYNFTESRHSSSCARCQDVFKADSISIDVHEWPLPTNYLQAKSVVFELNVPPSFGSWRDITAFFILDVLKFGYTKTREPRTNYQLGAYQGLCLFFQSAVTDQRIGLLSENKPHESTHRNQRLLGIVTEGDVCLKNGLHFQCFDREFGCFTCEWERTPGTESMCTYRLPQQSSSLQKFLFRPAEEPNGPSPNTVIATQSAAPMSMTLEEFRSLAAMPLGIEVQWLNILSELSTSSVDFKKSETAIFFLHIMNQAGPPGNSMHLRQGHMILDDPKFVNDILNRIAEVFERIKENWEMVQGLSCLIFLVLRILSLSPTPGISALCLQRLADLRMVAFHWVKLVKDKASQTIDDTQKTEFIAKYVHIALVCAETYDAENLDEVFETPSDDSIFIQCCMMIHDRKNALSITSDPVLPILYHRWQKLMHRSHSVLTDSIVRQNDHGLDQAILEAWAEYRTPNSWSMASNEHVCWLKARTSCQSADETSKLLHYNLLTGELLVDGTPLARLPSSYERHSTYQSLFGRSQLEIVPSNLRGMRFSCKQQYMGHAIHLVEESISDSESDLYGGRYLSCGQNSYYTKISSPHLAKSKTTHTHT